MRCKPCLRRKWEGCALRDSGPRQIDPTVGRSLRLPSVLQYRAALTAFLAFLSFYSLSPSQPWEVDDLLVEWKNDPCSGKAPSKKQFETAIAAVEKIMPTFKGHLLYSRSVLNGWRVTLRPSHTVPMSLPLDVPSVT